MTKYFKKNIKGLIKVILCKCWYLFPDELQIRWYYRVQMGKKLDLDDPQTMNEKLQWLKLHYRKDIMTSMVDKIKVKDIVSQKIGDQYIVPLLGQWNRFDDIEFDTLPNQFVLKTNHSAGNLGVVIVEDKSKMNKKEIRAKLEHSLKYDNVYHTYREWPYKNVERKIFAEEYLGNNIVDYKFHCFNGVADCVMLCLDRQLGDVKFYFFDKNWNLCKYNKLCYDAPAGFTLPKPDKIDKMFQLASTLSEGFPFARLDFYFVNGKIYFGEYTFFPASGYDDDNFPEADKYLGEKIMIPQEKAKAFSS